LGTTFLTLFLDVETGLAERLQFAKPEQLMVISMRCYGVSTCRQLLGMITAQTAERLFLKLQCPAPVLSVPSRHGIPFPTWSIGPSPLLGSASGFDRSIATVRRWIRNGQLETNGKLAKNPDVA
jgi:hypothetical protein